MVARLAVLPAVVLALVLVAPVVRPLVAELEQLAAQQVPEALELAA